MPKSPLATPPSALLPDWSRAKEILGGIQLAIRYSIAGQVLLGFELQELKRQLGFIGSGRRKEKTQDGFFLEGRTTWNDWCQAELGIGKSTADRFIDCFESVRLSVKKIGGTPKLLTLFSTPPSKLSDTDRATLEKAVAKAVDGQSQKDLLEELKLVKTPVLITGGDTSKSRGGREEPTTGQLAFSFFTPLATDLHKIRSSPDYQAYLHSLPVVSASEDEISLTALELQLSSALRDVQDAKKALSKS